MKYLTYLYKNFNLVFKIFILECILLFWNFFDFVLPEIILLSPIRERLFNLFWKSNGNFYLRRGNKFTRIGNISFGKNCRVNFGNIFDNNSKISVNDNCRIGFRNLFVTSTHIKKTSAKGKKSQIILGNNVWITSGCVILPGTKIGNNVILAANSVAKGNLESNWIYGGTPAKKIKRVRDISK